MAAKPSPGVYDGKYHPSPTVIYYNVDDPDTLFVQKNTVEVKLPLMPQYRYMVNYGLHPKDQFFFRPEMPPKLKELNKKRFKDIEDYWDEIKKNYEYYKDEIWFIKQEWKRREEGVWYLINGKGTYISKWHYFFLTSYTVGPTRGVYFDYRDRDRRWFIFAEYCDQNPLIYGFNCPKHRREGSTSKCGSVLLNCATAPDVRALMNNALKHGIQSKDADSAENLFLKHVVPQYKNLPFYFIPRNANPSSPKEKLNFGILSNKKSKEDKGEVEEGYLNTEIDFRASGELLYDGEKTRIFINDEAAKTKEANIEKRISTVRLCCSIGNQIIGLMINPSTAGEMDKEGGYNFKEVCNNSFAQETDDNGQTISGLVNVFMPAYDGLQGFIGPYGESIIDNPTEFQEEYMWKMTPDVCNAMKKRHKVLFGRDDDFRLTGARKYLENRRAYWLKMGKTEQLSKEKRQHPMSWKEIWTMNQDDSCPFDEYILTTRLEAFAVGGNPWVMYGDFVWENWDNTKWLPADLPTVEDLISGRTRVVWRPSTEKDKANAEWEISYLFPKDSDSNKVVWNHLYQCYEPGNKTKFAAGGDPIKNRVKQMARTVNKRSSFAAGSIYHKFDSSIDDINAIDPNAVDPNSASGDTVWKTDRFCGLYLKKPALKAMYGEAMLKACIYYGCTMYPEANLPYLTEYFDETRGFGEWLQFKINAKTKRLTTDFQHTNDKLITEIYGEWAEYIKRNGMREVHPTYLEQCLAVGHDGMGDNDAFASGGYAHLNVKQSKLYHTDEPLVKASFNANEIYDDFNAWQ